jgi:hypothetical protein
MPSTPILLGALHWIRPKSPMLMRMADWSHALSLTHCRVISASVKFLIPLAGLLKLPCQVHHVVATSVPIAVVAAIRIADARRVSRHTSQTRP